MYPGKFLDEPRQPWCVPNDGDALFTSNIDKEKQWDASLRTKLDEVGGLESRRREKDAVISYDADGIAMYPRESLRRTCQFVRSVQPDQ